MTVLAPAIIFAIDMVPADEVAVVAVAFDGVVVSVDTSSVDTSSVVDSSNTIGSEDAKYPVNDLKLT